MQAALAGSAADGMVSESPFRLTPGILVLSDLDTEQFNQLAVEAHVPGQGRTLSPAAPKVAVAGASA